MKPYDTGRFADVADADVARVASHNDVAHIVERMLADLRAHPNEWEHGALEQFLDALAASLEALPPLHANRGEPLPDQPTWKLIAEVLVKASGDE